MKELSQVLTSTRQSKSKNFLTLENARASLADYLSTHADEVRRFPEQKNLPHWNLIAADYDSKKDSHFLAMHFSKDKVTFLAGRGENSKVRAFAEDGFPEDPDAVLTELEKLFDTSPRHTTSLTAVQKWAAEIG